MVEKGAVMRGVNEWRGALCRRGLVLSTLASLARLCNWKGGGGVLDVSGFSIWC